MLAVTALVVALSACSTAPVRNGSAARGPTPQARLQLELIDRLGRSWTIDYMQVYLDGWLIWQGVPGDGSRRLAQPRLRTHGEQELYVRVVATNGHDDLGHFATGRGLMKVGTGTHRVRIRLTPDALRPGRFNVSLAQG